MNRTDRHDPTTDDPTDRESTPMGEVSHTHPHADRGTVNRPFERGPIVAADGGERDAYDAAAREEDDEDDSDRMEDVNHTPPHGDGVDRVFTRGNENEPVESEE
ncbi:hypothetical protein [Halorussus sp. MSC15.2]|uniref:hypothetical protein n=1 Tax=Halorussus sp. MSC15.2 TaxID=2283638 RepID=UPI001966F235|nr:hypothetical protein [Halorussus sp. MSC15.2]